MKNETIKNRKYFRSLCQLCEKKKYMNVMISTPAHNAMCQENIRKVGDFLSVTQKFAV